MNICLYTRVSDGESQLVENQIAQLREYCAKQGWNIVCELSDELSGKTDKRPRFQEMFVRASRREFDCVLVWNADRFTREGATAMLNHIQRLTGYGVDFQSFTEPHFTTSGPFREVFLAIAATFAKLEREKISSRTKAGLDRLRRKGVVLGRPSVRTELRVQVLDLRGQGVTDVREIARRTTYTTRTGEVRMPSTATVRRALAGAA